MFCGTVTGVSQVRNRAAALSSPFLSISSLLRFLWISVLFHCSASHQAATAWRSFPSSKNLLRVGNSKIIPTCNWATKTPTKKSQARALRDVRKRCYCGTYCSKNNNEEINAVGRGRSFCFIFNTLLYTKHALKCAFVELKQHFF